MLQSNYHIPHLPSMKRILEMMNDLKSETGLKQYELGQMLGVNQSTVARWFKGEGLDYEKARFIISSLLGHLTGIPQDKTVESIASFKPDSIEINEILKKAALVMLDNDYSQLPVTESGKYKGLLTNHGVVRYLLSTKPKRGLGALNWNEAPSVRRLEKFFETPPPITLDIPVVMVVHQLDQNYALPVKENLNDPFIVAIVTRWDMLKLIKD